MAQFVFTDGRFYLDGANYSGFGNEMEAKPSAELKDFTAFGSGQLTRKYKPGLYDGEFTFRGFQDYTDSFDLIFQNRVGGLVTASHVLMAAEGGDDGERAAFFQAVGVTYNQLTSAKIGEPGMFELKGKLAGGYPIIEGTLLLDGKTGKTTSGTGTAYQVGAVGATQKLYAAAHCFLLNAGNVTLAIESSADAGFSSPTTRITFSAFSAPVTALWATPVSGPITDTYWRAKWTLAGGATAASCLVVMGIL